MLSDEMGEMCFFILFFRILDVPLRHEIRNKLKKPLRNELYK